jgi:hypothetical protein
MKSNLKLKSNLFLRDQKKAFENDTEFIKRVRGVKGIRKLLLAAFQVPHNADYDDREVINLFKCGKLTKAQWNTLKWEIICYRCNSIPVGSTFSGEVEFRCKVEGCK